MKYLKPFRLYESIVNRSNDLTTDVIKDIFQEVIDLGYDVIVDDIMYERGNPLNTLHMRGFRKDYKLMFTSKFDTEQTIVRLPLFKRGVVISIGNNDIEEVMKNLTNQEWSIYKKEPKLFDKVEQKLRLENFDFEVVESKSEMKYIIKNGPFTMSDVDLQNLIDNLQKHAQEIL
jgi:Icc-related predicted phosphoesterase